MSAFLPEYSEQVNITICTSVTMLTLDSGELVTLGFGKGLWFGNIVDKSLINPN